jgi:cyclic beta-1,2-glucan synthetase
MVRLEHQRQATMNVTVRNVITSMRLISWFDWADFVESVCKVDEVLSTSGTFAQLDFATRDSYRKAVEEVARGCVLTEVEVAGRAVGMAASAPGADEIGPASSARRREPGYYLIADGRPALEADIGSRVRLSTRLQRAYVRYPALGYVLTVIALTAPALARRSGGPQGAPRFRCRSRRSAAILPASDCVALVNRMVTKVQGRIAPPDLETASRCAPGRRPGLMSDADTDAL